jgi:hypothetical protein
MQCDKINDHRIDCGVTRPKLFSLFGRFGYKKRLETHNMQDGFSNL